MHDPVIFACSRQSSPTKNPLFKMLWWLRVAPLGNPVVPDVYWMLIGWSAERSTARSSSCIGSGLTRGQLGPLRRTDEDDALEGGAARADLFDHGPVVRALELGRGDQQLYAGLPQHELELVGPIGRIDVDQNGADGGRGVLEQGPFGTVGGPYPDALPDRDARGQRARWPGRRRHARTGRRSSDGRRRRRSAPRGPARRSIVRVRLAPMVSPSKGVRDVPDS